MVAHELRFEGEGVSLFFLFSGSSSFLGSSSPNKTASSMLGMDEGNGGTVLVFDFVEQTKEPSSSFTISKSFYMK